MNGFLYCVKSSIQRWKVRLCINIMEKLRMLLEKKEF